MKIFTVLFRIVLVILGCIIGFIEGGLQNTKDKQIILTDELRANFLDIEIVSPHMYDPEGTRLHG